MHVNIAYFNVTDPRLCIRLVAAHDSGVAHIFTLGRVGDGASWALEGEPIKIEVSPHALRNGTTVLNAKTGHQCRTERDRFAAAMRATPSGEHVILVTAGAKGARCHYDITGDRMGKVDWGSSVGAVENVQVIEKLGTRPTSLNLMKMAQPVS